MYKNLAAFTGCCAIISLMLIAMGCQLKLVAHENAQAISPVEETEVAVVDQGCKDSERTAIEMPAASPAYAVDLWTDRYLNLSADWRFDAFPVLERISDRSDEEIDLLDIAWYRNADLFGKNYDSETIEALRLVYWTIRFQENGRDGLAFGVLSQKAATKDKQAGIAAASVLKGWQRYLDATDGANDMAAFIKHFGARYCPVGAENDPSGLNVNWVPNITSILGAY